MGRLIIIGGGPRRTFTAISASLTSASTFNFGTLSFGDALPNRKLVLGIASETTGTNFDFSSVSVAGNSATSIVNRAQSDTFGKSRAALYRIANATDASGNVTITLGGSVSRCRVGIWAAYDLTNAAPSFTGSDGDNDGVTSSFGLDIDATGLVFGVGVILGGSGTQTMSGFDSIDAEGGFTPSHLQWASYQAGSAEVARALSFSGAGSTDSARVLVAASWS